jgi:translocation and assembly module TamB
VRAAARKWLQRTEHLLVPLALLITLLGSFVAGILLHLPLPPSKRAATRIVMEQVSQAIRGSIEIERISRLHLGGVEAVGVTIRDPDGETVLFAPRLRARANLLPIALSFLPWSPRAEVPVSWIRAEHIDVVFRQDADGTVTLGTTFLEPIRPAEPPPKKPPTPARPLVVDLKSIEIGTIAAKGGLGGLSPLDWRARTVRGSVRIAPDGVRIDTASFPVAFDKILEKPVHATVDYHFRSPQLMWSGVLANYRDLSVSGRVQLNGNNLLVDLDLPRTEPQALAPFLPDGVVLADPVEGRIEAHGPLPVLDTHIRLISDRMLLDSTGDLTLSPRVRTDFDVDLRRVDLRKILPEAPQTEVDADLRVRVFVDGEGQPRARLTGDISPTVLLGVPVPGMDVDALVDAKGASGLAHVHEMGMPVRTDFTFTPSEGLRVTAVTNVPSLSSVPRLQRAVSGYAVAKLEGTYHEGEVDAKVTVSAGNLLRDGVHLGSANMELQLTGPPEQLRMNAIVHGRGAGVGDVRWDGLDLFAQGPIRTPHVRLHLQDKTLPHVTASANLETQQRLAARSVDLKLEQGRESVEAKTDLIEIRNGIVDLGALAIDGLGDPIDAVAAVGSKGFDVRVVSDGIDLDRLTYFLPIPGPRLTGIVGLDVDIRNIGEESHGCVRLDVRDGKVHSVPPVSGIDTSIRAQFTGRHVDVHADMSVGAKGEPPTVGSEDIGMCLPAQSKPREGMVAARATASLTLAGPPLEASSWRDATGTGRLVQLGLDLDRIQEIYGDLAGVASEVASVSIPSVKGKVEVHGDVVRDHPGKLPAWTFSATTRGVEVDLPGSAVNKVKADVFASAAIDTEGTLLASMCVRNNPASFAGEQCNPSDDSVLASVGLLAGVDYRRLVADPRSWKQVLYGTQLQGSVVVHDRWMDALLSPLSLTTEIPVDVGHASAVFGFRGTVLAPQIDYRVNIARVGALEPGWRAPVSICAKGQYDGDKAWMHAELRRTQESQTADAVCSLSPDVPVTSLGSLDAALVVAWKDVLAWNSLPRVPWVANVKAVVHDFELRDVPALAEQGISGRSRLTASIKDLGAKPEFDVQLGIEALRTGATVDYDQSHIRVHADASGLQGSLALIDVDENGNATSSMKVSVDTEQLQWSDGWWLTRDGTKPVNIAVDATRFKLGMLSPMVQPLFSYVEGELTGKAQAVWSPAEGKSRIKSMSFYVDNGAFQVPVIGQEFLQVRGLLQAADSERIYVERFQAQSLTGALEGRATIDLDDLDIEHVEASLWTKPSDKIRLTFGGMPVGDLYGTINVTVDPGDKQHDVTIEFDRVTVDLPRTDLRSVQQVDANSDIEIVPLLDSTVRSDAAADRVTPWVVTLQTKTPAVLQRFDMNFSVVLPKTGRDRLVLVYPDEKTGEVSLQGHVVLYDGRIDVVGNRFDLEENNARVIFTGDPGDPQLNVTARWEAPDGTRVFADVTGPLREPRIQFRSEPAMTQAEILALVLFGPSTQGGGTTAVGTAEGEGTAGADVSGGVSGGVASAGINMLLQDLSPVVSTRIDTSRGQTPSPTLVVQVSRDVTAEATYVAEEATLDKTDRYLVTFDWRFLRQWSLRITRGNVGTSILDVIWQHRY